MVLIEEREGVSLMMRWVTGPRPGHESRKPDPSEGKRSPVANLDALNVILYRYFERGHGR